MATKTHTSFETALLVGSDRKDLDRFVVVYKESTGRQFEKWDPIKKYKNAFIEVPVEYFKNRSIAACNLLIEKRHDQNAILITATVSELVELKKDKIWWKDFVTLFGGISFTDKTIEGLPIAQDLIIK